MIDADSIGFFLLEKKLRFSAINFPSHVVINRYQVIFTDMTLMFNLILCGPYPARGMNYRNA
ncbi:hypothetical protein ACTXT7_012573 [Hymenolepis weldensis]